MIELLDVGLLLSDQFFMLSHFGLQRLDAVVIHELWAGDALDATLGTVYLNEKTLFVMGGPLISGEFDSTLGACTLDRDCIAFFFEVTYQLLVGDIAIRQLTRIDRTPFKDSVVQIFP